MTSRSPPDSWFLVTVTVKRVTRGVLHSVHVKLPSRQDAQPPVPWSVETHPGLEGATMMHEPSTTQGTQESTLSFHRCAHITQTGRNTGGSGSGGGGTALGGFRLSPIVISRSPPTRTSGHRWRQADSGTPQTPLSETESEPETMTTKCRLLSRDECTVSFNVKEPSPSQPETLWLQVQLELPLHVTELHVAWESPTSRHLRPLCYARGGP